MKNWILGVLLSVAFITYCSIPVMVATMEKPVPMVQTERTQAEMVRETAEATVIIQAWDDYGQSWYGSGFFVSNDGYLVTAGHVVDGAKEFEITMLDGCKYKSSDYYKVKDVDCSVIKFDIDFATPFVEMRVEQMKMGEDVYILGWPHGPEFGLSVNKGIGSGDGREVPFFGNTPLLQVDLEANPGNSGGILFDTKGRAIGILIGARMDMSCMTFCTPIDIAIAALDAFKAERIIDAFRYEPILQYGY